MANAYIIYVHIPIAMNIKNDGYYLVTLIMIFKIFVTIF